MVTGTDSSPTWAPALGTPVKVVSEAASAASAPTIAARLVNRGIERVPPRESTGESP